MQTDMPTHIHMKLSFTTIGNVIFFVDEYVRGCVSSSEPKIWLQNENWIVECKMGVCIYPERCDQLQKINVNWINRLITHFLKKIREDLHSIHDSEIKKHKKQWSAVFFHHSFDVDVPRSCIHKDDFGIRNSNVPSKADVWKRLQIKILWINNSHLPIVEILTANVMCAAQAVFIRNRNVKSLKWQTYTDDSSSSKKFNWEKKNWSEWNVNKTKKKNTILPTHP